MGYGTTPYGETGYGLGGDTTPPTVIITDVTRTKISANPCCNSTVLSWYSNEDGNYYIEINGTGKGTGYFVESSGCYSGVPIETVITDDDLEEADLDQSDGIYRVNIYVTDSSGNTTPHEGF